MLRGISTERPSTQIESLEASPFGLWLRNFYLGDCHNYGPSLGPYYHTGPNTGPSLGDPKRDHNFDNPPLKLVVGAMDV